MQKKVQSTNDANRPVKPYDHLEDAYGNACSQTECTGLIAHAPLTEEELESFMDIYDFSPPIVSGGNAEEGIGPAYGSHITADSSKENLNNL